MVNPFQKTKEEKAQAHIYKALNKFKRKKYYGADWRKHLNVPNDIIEVPFKIKMS